MTPAAASSAGMRSDLAQFVARRGARGDALLHFRLGDGRGVAVHGIVGRCARGERGFRQPEPLRQRHKLRGHRKGAEVPAADG